MALALAGGAIALSVVTASQLYLNWVSQGYEASFVELLSAKLVEWGLWAAYVPVIVQVERHHGFMAAPVPRALLAHGASAGAFFLVVNSALSGFTMAVDPVVAGKSFTHVFIQRAGSKLLVALVVYAIVVAGYWLLYLREESHRQAAVGERLRADLSEARLLSLKMQIHPHFLFNTLHVIAELVREGDRETAVDTIEELAGLLRRALREADQQTVPLREELEFLHAYLRIQKLRFGDRISFEVDVDPAAADRHVPSLLLQPLVENAIRHGFGLDRRSGTVRIRVRRDDGRLNLAVEDDGAGLTSEPVREGLGLGNVRRRLDHLYKDEARLDIRPAPEGGTVVEICLPDVRPSQGNTNPPGPESGSEARRHRSRLT